MPPPFHGFPNETDLPSIASGPVAVAFGNFTGGLPDVVTADMDSSQVSIIYQNTAVRTGSSSC